MNAEIIGIDKIEKYLDRYDFQKIKLSRGTETVYLKRASDGETKADLVSDLVDWHNEFITPDNFKVYKLEVFGTYKTDPNAKLSPVVKCTVAFNDKATVTGALYNVPSMQKNNDQTIDIEKYVTVSVENARLQAKLEQMEEKLDQILADEEEEEELGAIEQPTVSEQIQNAVLGRLDSIIDAVIMGFMNKNQNATPAINGVDLETDTDVLTRFKAIHPNIESDLEKLLILAKTKPDFFKMLIAQLNSLV